MRMPEPAPPFSVPKRRRALFSRQKKTMLEHELPATAEQETDNNLVYELEAPNHESSVLVPLVTVSDYEPIISAYSQLREQHQHMNQYVQEIVTRDIIMKDQLERARSNCKAAESGIILLWEIVRQQFEGSEGVVTPAEIVQFLATRDLNLIDAAGYAPTLTQKN
ncbi:hypothetical protein Daus18300_005343 [Diaporthe australafricana]|uniref:Uncharacterized protein n=1 Tax=Diaporthe australafricana TaxID=127596 RepID=A0ABR3X1W4_9PEZI